MFDKIDYKEEDDVSLLDNITPTEHVRNSYDELAELVGAFSEMLGEIIPDTVPETNDENETADENEENSASDEEQVTENEPSDEEKQEENTAGTETEEKSESNNKKEKRGFFGLFNRHS